MCSFEMETGTPSQQHSLEAMGRLQKGNEHHIAFEDRTSVTILIKIFGCLLRLGKKNILSIFSFFFLKNLDITHMLKLSTAKLQIFQGYVSSEGFLLISWTLRKTRELRT